MRQETSLIQQLNELVARNANAEAAGLLNSIDIAFCPDIDSCINILGTSMLCDDKQIVEKIIQNIPYEFKNDFSVNLKIGDLYEKFDDDLNAQRFYQKGEQIRPDNAWSYVRQGRYLGKKGDFKQAVAVLARGFASATEAASGADIIETLQQDYIRFSCLSGRADIRYGRAIIGRRFYEGRALDNALFISMVKDEGDIIFESLRSAYATGFRNFFIANNGSTDETQDKILHFAKAYEGANVVLMTDPICGFWQARKINVFWRFAVEYLKIRGTIIDWIFPVDGDEFVVQTDPCNDLYGLLHSEEAIGKTLLYGMWCNATPTVIQDDWIEPGNADKTFPIVSGYSDDVYARTKIAFRVSAIAQLEDGNHFAKGCVGDASTVASLNDQGIFLIHHPIRSRTQFRSKITNGVNGLYAATTLDANIGHHWRVTYERYQQEGESYIDLALHYSYESNRIASERFTLEVKAAHGDAD